MQRATTDCWVALIRAQPDAKPYYEPALPSGPDKNDLFIQKENTNETMANWGATVYAFRTITC